MSKRKKTQYIVDYKRVQIVSNILTHGGHASGENWKRPFS